MGGIFVLVYIKKRALKIKLTRMREYPMVDVVTEAARRCFAVDFHDNGNRTKARDARRPILRAARV
jgi:uncharacterized protein YlbG (UPF0298 family)